MQKRFFSLFFVILLHKISAQFLGGQIKTPNLYQPNSVFCNGLTPVVPVINPITGKTWMDRNLGALQPATSSTDAASYGDLYQWGRRSDGHQCRTSLTTTVLSASDTPNHGDFIRTLSSPTDWRNPQNSNLWQGVNGINNPCPIRYRIPTESELNTERLSWISYDAAGAYASPLKLTVAGLRSYSSGLLAAVGVNGYIFSSTINGTFSRGLRYSSGGFSFNDDDRADGFSVRCIKD
jgi:uncharacterized protein (TIGR02145 family)